MDELLSCRDILNNLGLNAFGIGGNDVSSPLLPPPVVAVVIVVVGMIVIMITVYNIIISNWCIIMKLNLISLG